MTELAPRTDAAKGWRKGEPRPYIAGHHHKTRSPGYRVDERGCWVWKGRLERGYGRTALGGRRQLAHVYHWEKEHGPVPEGHQIDHLCRNRACVNPDHLEPVTPAENVRRSSTAKMDEEAAAIIRSTPRRSNVVHELAERFGVSYHAIVDVRSGRTWRSV